MRLDFGRLLASGKWTVDPSGAGLRGLGSGFRSSSVPASPFHLSLCAPISGQGFSGRAVRSVSWSRRLDNAVRLSRSRVCQSRRGDRGALRSSAPWPCGPPSLFMEGQDWLVADTDVSGPSFPLSPHCLCRCRSFGPRRGLDHYRSAAEPGLRRQNRLQLCISGLF